MSEYRVVEFRPEYAVAFKTLNIAWLQRYFVVEPIDEQVLSNPQAIIDAGGFVFVCVRTSDNEPVGVVALLHEGNGVFELSKMAVDPSAQGHGLGRQLLHAAIDRFVEVQGTELFLESNSKLTPALTLYESAGFVHQQCLMPGSHYDRADVYMIWNAETIA